MCVVYGCQNVHPVYAFDMELQRLKRERFSPFFYLEVSRMGLLPFDRAGSPRKIGALILAGALTRFIGFF